MANQLHDDYYERGMVIIHVLIEGETTEDPTWEDAHTWAYERDFDGAGPYEPPLKVLVIADTDGQLWSRYAICPLTPQSQTNDRGMVNVDDACNLSNLCGSCGYSDSATRTLFDSILPDQSCGATTD